MFPEYRQLSLQLDCHLVHFLYIASLYQYLEMGIYFTRPKETNSCVHYRSSLMYDHSNATSNQ